MKKMVCFSLCLVMLFFTASIVFAGGGGQRGSGQNLVLYTEFSEGEDDAFLRRVVQNFERQNSGVSIEIMSSESQSFDTFFKTAVAGNEQIDIAQINIQFYRDYVTRGFLRPLDGLVDFSKVPRIQTAWDQERYFSRQNQRFGVPMRMDSSGFYYNTEIFRRLGIEIPRTWNDIFAMREKLAPAGIFPMVYAGAEPWWNPMHFNIIFYQMTGNRGLEINDRFMAGDFSPEVIRPYIDTLQFFADLDANGIFIPGTQGMDHPSAMTVFSTGRAAMYYMGSWYQESLAAGAPNFQYGVFPVPVLEQGLRSEPAGSIAVMFSIYRDSRHPEMAARFIEYYGSPAIQQERFNSGIAAINIIPGVVPDLSDPIKAAFDQIGPSTCIWLDAIWEPEIITAFQQGCQAAILRQRTPTQIMDDIIAQYRQLRAQGRTFF